MDSSERNKMSYIRARDPSISGNYKRREIRHRGPLKLRNEDPITESSMEQTDDSDFLNDDLGKLDVFLRIKSATDEDNLYMVSDNTLKCQVPEMSQNGRNIKEGEQLSRIYSFTKIFPSKSSQIEIFDQAVKKKVLKFMNGINANLMTYGPSGAGKTFTIVGTTEEPGMIPQSLEYLFRSTKNLKNYPVVKPKSGHTSIKWLSVDEIEQETNELTRLLHSSDILPELNLHIKTYTDMQKRLSKEAPALLDDISTNVSVWISFAEIYNEYVYDLLVPVSNNSKSRPKLKIYNNKGETYIKDLKQIFVADGHEAYCLLQYGLLNLNYASTSINSHSSRSHSIFTISLVQSDPNSDGYRLSRINFCDLAGSERCKKTNNVGSRLNESNNINTSLMVLGRCISAIRKEQQKTASKSVIPFRESKLTQLFHKALQGEEDISMIVAINPDRYMFDETIHALNFSAIAKEITLEKISDRNVLAAKAAFEVGIPAAQYEALIDTLQQQVADLSADLDEERILQFERESKVRQDLVRQFEVMLKEKDEVMYLKLQEKNEYIAELQQENANLRDAMSDPDSSVISISSNDGDTSIRALNKTTERYDKLFSDSEELKKQNYLLEQKVDEQAKLIATYEKRLANHMATIAWQDEQLKKQKLDIIKLQEENACLDKDVEASIRYSNFIARDLEGREGGSDSTHSESDDGPSM